MKLNPSCLFATALASLPPSNSLHAQPLSPEASASAALEQESVQSLSQKAQQTSHELDKVSRLFDTAQRLFGYEHVLLTSIIYSGERCSDESKDSFWSCGTASGA